MNPLIGLTADIGTVATLNLIHYYLNMPKKMRCWPTGEIYIYKPTSFYSSATMQSPVVSVEMVRPIAIGTALTLTADTDVSCYSIQTRVTTPSGSTSTSTSYNTTSATKTYTFNSVGLYTIRVAVKQTSSSTAYYYYYTVRVY